MAGKHIAVWPRVRVSVVKGDKTKSVIVERGDLVPSGVSDVDLENLVSFGAIAGVTEALAPEPEDDEPKPGTAAYVLKEVGTDKALAQVALDEELAGQNRKGLVADLEKILAG